MLGRLMIVSFGSAFAAVILYAAILFAPGNLEQFTSPVKEVAEVQSAGAWYYDHAMCDSSLRRGDWLQHKHREDVYHRSVRLDKYTYQGFVYVNIRKQVVHYNPFSRRSLGIYPVQCWPA